MKLDKRTIFYSFICFSLPFTIFALTKSSSLMFDDAAEFSLVIKLASIAHPPGTPAYIFFGTVWDSLFSLFSSDTIAVLTLFSSFCISLGSLFFFLSLRKIIRRSYPVETETRVHFVALLAALIFATGATTWSWANTVEVYAFQVAAMSLMLFGLVTFHCDRSKLSLLLASVGYSLGLANHHVEAVFFAPFVPLFFMDGLFTGSGPHTEKRKKGSRTDTGFLSEYWRAMKRAEFLMMVGLVTLCTAAFYFWMYWRAQRDYPFMFGQPNTLDLLWYHIKGGNYGKNLQSTTESIRATRVHYFLSLTFSQYLLALPLLLLGLYELVRRRLYRLCALSLLFYGMMFGYQLNNNQWSSTDAYMLIPFFFLTIPLAFAVVRWFSGLRLKLVVPLLIAANFAYNLPLHNRRDYTVSESLLHLLGESAPKNSVVVISDWSLIIQYYYARIVENFRPDLIVLNYDMKFTHYKILPILYPEFYQSIKKEYDAFILHLRRAHPEEIAGTGCDLDSYALLTSFKDLIRTIEAVSLQQHRPFLTDPKAHFFFSQQKIYGGNRYVAGCFVSSVPTVNNDAFLQMKEQWLDSPLLLHDPAALDKLVDFQAMLDNHLLYFTSVHDSARLEMANSAKEKIMRLQREMKAEMSFAYEVK